MAAFHIETCVHAIAPQVTGYIRIATTCPPAREAGLHEVQRLAAARGQSPSAPAVPARRDMCNFLNIQTYEKLLRSIVV
jgi:hypothetical protein